MRREDAPAAADSHPAHPAHPVHPAHPDDLDATDQAGGRSRDRPRDLRMPVVAAVAWGGALAGAGVRRLPDGSGGPVLVVAAILGAVSVVAGVAVAVVVRSLRPRVAGRRADPRTAGALAAVFVVLLTSTALRLEQVGDGPVADLAAERAAVALVATVTSDPKVVTGRFGDQRLVRVTAHEVVGRGHRWRVRSPVLVIGDPDELDGAVRLGAEVRLVGRLGPARDGDVAAVLSPSSAAERVGDPGLAWQGADRVRASIRAAVAHRPAEQAALVPALVDGDDASVDDTMAEEFRTTGLTHLLAVSGTNLTLLVGFLLVLARWCRVRGRWLLVVAAAGIVGFVLLARTEPSVLRAAVMGSVGLLALSTNGRQRAVRALGVAVTVLLLAQPALAVSAGFVLSVLATAGIVLVAPGWRDALARWAPRWLAEAVAVPAAAQLACTPVVAAISGQVSLVAVVANLLVAPVVGPATVLGLAGGLVGLVWPVLGRLLGTGAGWCVAWIIAVAHRGAALPTAAVSWGTGPPSLVLLTVITVAVALLGPVLLRRRAAGVACAVVMLVVLFVRLPTPGWPPTGWVMVMCDVGQGDALVLRSGEGQAVVVDAGPDPGAVDRCLDRLSVDQLPLVVLTHFHADHVDGLPGVLEGRAVGLIETTTLLDPPGAVRSVLGEADERSVVPLATTAGESVAVGALTLRTLWPEPGVPRPGPGDGSTANDASVVLLAETGGVRLLLTGDLEPEGQAALARALPDLRVDVLKMPHHGSRYQDEPWLLSLEPDVVLVSVGADNDYGHPAAEAIDPLSEAGADVERTDESGDLAVVPTGGGGVEVRSRGSR